MKYKIEFEGDYYEDFNELREIVSIREMARAIHDAQEIIRSRLKYKEPSEQEVEILEQIRSALYVEAME